MFYQIRNYEHSRRKFQVIPLKYVIICLQYAKQIKYNKYLLQYAELKENNIKKIEEFLKDQQIFTFDNYAPFVKRNFHLPEICNP